MRAFERDDGESCTDSVLSAPQWLALFWCYNQSRRGLETKRSLQPWTQVLELRFTPNPGLESEHRADAAKGFNG